MLIYVAIIRANAISSATLDGDALKALTGDDADTDAFYTASLGTPAVDEKPYKDERGSFYSAYSPVFDSAGEVAGVVGADFSAQWFDDQIARYTRTVLIFNVVALVAGVFLILLIRDRIRRGIRQLDGELRELGDGLESLTKKVETMFLAPAFGQGLPAQNRKRRADSDPSGEIEDLILICD